MTSELDHLEVEARYLNDAEFHYRVDLAVVRLQGEYKYTFDVYTRNLATLVAAYTLALMEERSYPDAPPHSANDPLVQGGTT